MDPDKVMWLILFVTFLPIFLSQLYIIAEDVKRDKEKRLVIHVKHWWFTCAVSSFAIGYFAYRLLA